MAEDRCRWKETQSRVRVHTCGHSLLHRSHGEKRLANLRLKFIKFICIGIIFAQEFRLSNLDWKICAFWKRPNPLLSTSSTTITVNILISTEFIFWINWWKYSTGSLPDASDRVFSTVITSRWEYSTVNVDFCKAWYF
jgi:hypothetical protein